MKDETSPLPSFPGGWPALPLRDVFDQGGQRPQIEKLVESIVDLVARNGLGQGPGTRTEEGVATLAVPRSQPPGGTGSVFLTLANDDQLPIILGFRATDLLSSEGAVIPATQVSFAPRDITLAPLTNGTVEILIAVPAGARSGLYAGLVQTIGEESVRSVILLDVAV